MTPCELVVPKAFLKDFFEYLFYSILPDYSVMGEKSTVILEPICFLKIKDMIVVDWRLIDELIDRPFDITKIKSNIGNGIDAADWSELDQVLHPVFRNVLELHDNPFFYPGERLGNVLTESLPRNPQLSSFIDGVAHFHPTKDARHSGADFQAMKRISNVMARCGKKFVIGLIIARGTPRMYIEKSKESKFQFIKYLLNDLKGTNFTAEIFHRGKAHKCINVVIK